MSIRSTVHDTFIIQRSFAFAPDLVFAAWSTTEAKSQWFVGSGGWVLQHRELDFRVGGHEQLIGRRSNGGVNRFDARYFEILPNERIVYAYEMHSDETRISVSLATIEFKRRQPGTQLVITEQGVFLDDFTDVRGREQGTRALVDQLERALHQQPRHTSA